MLGSGGGNRTHEEGQADSPGMSTSGHGRDT